MDPCSRRDRSHAWARSPKAAAIARMGPGARVEWNRSVVRGRACGDTGDPEAVHLFPVLMRLLAAASQCGAGLVLPMPRAERVLVGHGAQVDGLTSASSVMKTRRISSQGFGGSGHRNWTPGA